MLDDAEARTLRGLYKALVWWLKKSPARPQNSGVKSAVLLAEMCNKGNRVKSGGGQVE